MIPPCINYNRKLLTGGVSAHPGDDPSLGQLTEVGGQQGVVDGRVLKFEDLQHLLYVRVTVRTQLAEERLVSRENQKLKS